MTRDPRLENLKHKIQSAKASHKPSASQTKSSQTLSGKFFNVGVELTAGVMVGVGLGLLMDWIFNLSPWGLITFFILGSAAGMMNVYRALIINKPKDHKKNHHD
jgi:ATP synthase protein I